ncbi:MAG TPA: hypothetical protein QGF58_13210 [Myxococcota bacterium]|nr:hypothetical protein [Myxococcota bacterium]
MHLLLITAVQAQDCEALDLDAQVDAAVTAVTDDELGEASRLAEEGLANLVCQSRVPDPEDIASLYQVQGAAGVYSGRPQLADSALRQARVTYAGYFNERLGSSVQEVWEGLEPAGSGTLTAWPIPDEGVLYVDGLARAEQPVALGAGTHLVQVALGAEVAYVDSIELADGQLLEMATGLPEPTKARRVSPWLIGTVSAAGLGGGLYAGAVTFDGVMNDEARSKNPELDVIDQNRSLSVGLASGAAVAAVVGAVSLAMWTREQVKKKKAE